VTTIPANIPDDRPFTSQEISLIEWLLVNGGCPATNYLEQLRRARVVARCACGCASINLGIGGRAPTTSGPLKILADYWWKTQDGHQFGVFLFARDAALAGLDVWSVDGLATANHLPAVDQLQPLRLNSLKESAGEST
jgi:hypothetical protein